MYKDFFKQIDTEEKAYWLGFIAADGNIRKDLNCCSIELQRADREHLIKFSKCFDDYYQVQDCDRLFPSSKIRIDSKQCCLDLQQYGIIPNKSLILDIKTELIPDFLIKHYIRGYFDGDGSIYCSYPNRLNGYNYDEWGINFVGTYNVLSFFKTYLKISNNIIKKNNIYELNVNGTLKAYEILSFLYEDAAIYLDRKKEKFKELQSSQRLSKLVSKRDYFAEEKDTSILVGFILGGACIRKLIVSKTSKDIASLQEVKEIFDKYNYKCELKRTTLKQYEQYALQVHISPEIATNYKHQFYPNGNKTITRHLLNELNNDALYIWFLLNSHNIDGGLALGTSKFTEDENKIIQNYFNVVHKIDAKLRHRREKVFIYLPKKDLFDKVYVPRSKLSI